MIGQIFNGFDANGDGLLVKEEFQQGFTAWFTLWDVGKNGELSVGEIQDGLKSKLPAGPPMPREEHP